MSTILTADYSSGFYISQTADISETLTLLHAQYLPAIDINCLHLKDLCYLPYAMFPTVIQIRTPITTENNTLSKSESEKNRPNVSHYKEETNSREVREIFFARSR